MSETTSGSVGCGCFSLILGFLTLWALWFGLEPPWGEFHIDLIPPALRLLP